ncbi:MAG: restriction endonuclease subunit S [Treponema sp.]|jgi:type I restriction enzyme S subunit|nr:restriction endonuclease subunit S [Treponema sp.]
MKKVKVRDIVESISITHKFDKPRLKFLNTSDVDKGKIVNINYLPIEKLKGQAKKTIKKDDILFSEIRPKNGRYAYVDIEDTEDFVVSTKLMVLRKVNNEVDNKYFYYWLTNDAMLSELQNRAENRICSFPQITFDLLSEYEILLPPLSTQSAIACILSSLDDKIELNNKINKELENLAKTIYEYWFVQNTGKEWERKSLYDIATFTNGLACQKFRPQGKEFYKVIKIKEMREGFTKDTELVDTSIPTNVIVNDGDILFSWSASLEVIIWTGGIGGLNQHIFKVTSDRYPKSFVYFQLMHYLNHFRVIANNRRTTMGHITIDHLKHSEIYIPPANIIMKVDKTVSPLFSAIIKNRQESNYLAQLRDFLLPLLMNGQVEVNNKK